MQPNETVKSLLVPLDRGRLLVQLRRSRESWRASEKFINFKVITNYGRIKMPEQTTPKLEEILRKHAEKNVAKMDPGFKRLRYPDMSNEQIVKKTLGYYSRRARLQKDGTVIIYQNYGYYIIDKEGNDVYGICGAD